MLSGFSADIRHAARGLVRSPGTALAAVVVLALGVGAPTAMYSITTGLGRRLSIEDANELLSISKLTGGPGGERQNLTLRELEVLRDELSAIGTIAAYSAGLWDLGSDGVDPERVVGAEVTSDLLALLREQPIRGRGFVVEDDAEGVALIGERLWRARFGGDPTILGRSIRVNGAPRTIVGILPASLRFPEGAQVWTPIAPADQESATTPVYVTVARLPAGATLERIQAELQVLRPEAGGSDVFVANPFTSRSGEGRTFLFGMLATVTLLLLVAASNVANLFLCRAVARRHDTALRTALGAGRSRIVAIHLVESLLVSVVGGSIGVIFAIQATRWFQQELAGQLEWWMEIRVQPGMLIFALALVVAAALLAGLAPARQALSRQVTSGLSGSGREVGDFRLSRVSERLVILEVMFSVALLAQAAFVADPFLDQRDQLSVGFESRSAYAAAYSFRDGELSDGERLSFHRELLDRAAERPGVGGAAVFTPFPGGEGGGRSVQADDGQIRRLYDRDETQVVHVSPGAFELLDISILRGRDLTWADGDTEPPAVLVNEAFAERVFPGQDPIGQRIRFGLPEAGEQTATIVGVVPPVAAPVSDREFADAIYVPITMGSPRDTYVVLRAAVGVDPSFMLPELRSALDALDIEKPLHSGGTLEELVTRESAFLYTLGNVFFAAALAALLIAGTGLYAVMAFSVARRTREVGVRVALGATRTRVIRDVMSQVAAHLAKGLLLGTALTVGVAPMFLAADSSRYDWTVYALVVSTLLMIGLLAAIVPSVRAVRIEPAAALRSE
jgi:predicted permease